MGFAGSAGSGRLAGHIASQLDAGPFAFRRNALKGEREVPDDVQATLVGGAPYVSI